MNWSEETVKELWDNIKKEMTGLIRFMAFDDSNDLIMDIIKEKIKYFKIFLLNDAITG